MENKNTIAKNIPGKKKKKLMNFSFSDNINEKNKVNVPLSE